MDKEYLLFIQSKLFEIRDGMLGDSSRTTAAYNLGLLVCSINLTLQEMDSVAKKKPK